MRTNIEIDDNLMKRAIVASGFKTKKRTVEAALTLLVQVHSQEKIRHLRGELNWEGSLEDMRRATHDRR